MKWQRAREVLLGHADVEQAYVVGIPDPRKEEVLVAAVVLKESRDVTAEALRAFCRERLAAFKVPQRFRFVKRSDLPVTASGKVQKAKLSETLAAERPGDGT